MFGNFGTNTRFGKAPSALARSLSEDTDVAQANIATSETIRLGDNRNSHQTAFSLNSNNE